MKKERHIEDAQVIEKIRKNYENILINFIKEIVCNYYNVNEDVFYSKKKKRHFVKIKYVCIYLITTNTEVTVTDLGKRFNINHGTVIHGRDNIKGYLTYDDKLKKEVSDLQQMISEKAYGFARQNALNENFHFIDLNEFYSAETEENKFVLFVGYNEKDIELIKKRLGKKRVNHHKETKLYLLELKNK